jgi:rubrerythrin
MDTKTDAMFTTALEMEERGYERYQGFVSTCKNELGRELFTTLRDDELVHVERIKRIYEAAKRGETAWKQEFAIDDAKTTPEGLNAMFASMTEKHGDDVSSAPLDADDIAALDVGIDFELHAVAFYEGHLPHAVDDLEREFTKRMIAEERFHHRALVDTKLFLTNPAAWHRETEKGGLDGA